MYELRAFANNSLVRLATSGTFSVQAASPPTPDPAATLNVTPSTIAAGTNVTATWSDIASPMPGDWIGLYIPDTSDNALVAASWVYVSCSQVKGGVGLASGSCSFQIPMPVVPGIYELRLFSNNSLLRLAKSNKFTIN
jgi:hypothetical protein